MLKHQLFEDLLKYYLDVKYKTSRSGNFDSKIININVISLISKWIDKVDINSDFVYKRELYLPYEFKLLLRGSRDEFTPKYFIHYVMINPRLLNLLK